MENSKFIKILQRKGFRAYRATEKRVCEQKDDKYSSVYFIHHRRGNGYPRQIIVRMKIRTIIFYSIKPFIYGAKLRRMRYYNNRMENDFMKTAKGFANIFDLGGDAICVTTNGMIKNDGLAVMGAGIAKEADNKYKIARTLGQKLRETGNHVFDMGVNQQLLKL